MRIFIAGFIGAIVFFIWGAVAHMVLPFGEMGMKVATNQEATLGALQSAGNSGAGVYMVPGMSAEAYRDDAQREAFIAKYKDSPGAFIVYDPSPNPVVSSMAPNLLKQFISGYFVCLLAAWIMASSAAGFATRVAMGGAMGLLAWFATNIPYWNWYRFPMDFTVGALLDYGLGLLIASIPMAWWLGRSR
ncbi:hypothetical protein LVB87_12260 [Lysobacter sp. KIS68-7]|uniref:hypothetical protein n=1 Tax=Lysobacter sp. KIS68-7 TaxID=2904252 RepID=UPI001E3AA869|nr:hypothetical protein [Lysobacter sp. KIS68-7]UHQ18952.1 hypothetical protein LVB87_12260 [Lysobacter sp. KIS68-7]